MGWVTKLKLWVKNAWALYGSRCLLGLAFILVGLFSFQAGLLQNSLNKNTEPVIIRVAESAPASETSKPTEGIKPASLTVSSQTATQSSSLPTVECQLVGSKKSNKYHHPASRCAKQIKPENKRCFASIEDAKAKGYLPGCLEP